MSEEYKSGLDFSNISHVRENIVCADGFKISFQASYGHYCQPRVNQWNDRFNNIMMKDRTEDEMVIINESDQRTKDTDMVYYTHVEVLMREYDDYCEKYMNPYYCSCDKCPGGHSGDIEEPFMMDAVSAMVLLMRHGGAVQGHIPHFCKGDREIAWKRYHEERLSEESVRDESQLIGEQIIQ